MTADEKKPELYGPGRACRKEGLELQQKLQESHVLRDGEYNVVRDRRGPDVWRTSFSDDFQGHALERSVTQPALSHARHNFQLGNDSGQTVPLYVYQQSTTKGDFTRQNAPKTKIRREDETVHWPDMAPHLRWNSRYGDSEYVQSFGFKDRSGSDVGVLPIFPKVDTFKAHLPLDPARFHHQRSSSYQFGSDERSTVSEQQRVFGRVNGQEDLSHRLPRGLRAEAGTVTRDTSNSSSVFRLGDYNNLVGDMQSTTVTDYGPRTREPGHVLASQLLQQKRQSTSQGAAGETLDVANELMTYARAVTVPGVYKDAKNTRTDQESAHFLLGSDPYQKASVYGKDFMLSAAAARAVPRVRPTPNAGKLFQNDPQFSEKPLSTKSLDFMNPPPLVKSGDLERTAKKMRAGGVVLSCDPTRHSHDRQVSLSHADYVGPPAGYRPLERCGERAVPYPFLQTDTALPYPGLPRQSEAASNFAGSLSSGSSALDRLRTRKAAVRERLLETKSTHFTVGYQTPEFTTHNSLIFSGTGTSQTSMPPAGKIEPVPDSEFEHLRHSSNTLELRAVQNQAGMEDDDIFTTSVMKSDYRPGKRLTAEQEKTVDKFEKLLDKPFAQSHFFHTDNSGRNNYVSTTMDDFIKPEKMTGGRKRLAAK